MLQSAIGLVAATAALFALLSGAQAFDETKYPDWKGQWSAIGGGRNSSWDATKPPGAGEQAPLTPEYQAIFDANARDFANGGPEPDPSVRCTPAGMPRVMLAEQPMEIVTTPNTAYFIFGSFNTLRLVYTDGRKFPNGLDASFAGYSIGEWQDTDGDGRFDTLLIETRGIKGPHTYDASGIPFHTDEEAVVREKVYSDRADPNILHDEITTLDHVLTRPWTVTRSYRRDPGQGRPEWSGAHLRA